MNPEVYLMKSLIELPYRTREVLEEGKVVTRSFIEMGEITKLLNSARKSLKQEGLMYVNGEAKPI